MRNRATRMIAWLLTVLMLVTCLPSGMLSGGASLADGSVIDYSESVQLPWSEVSPEPRKPAVDYVTGDTSLGILVYSAINGTYIPQGTRPTAEIQTPGDAAQAAADAQASQTGHAGRVLSQFRLGSSDDGWQPDGPIRVTVNLNEPLGTYDNEALTLARLTDEGEAVSINTPLIARGNQLRAFSFTTDALAVYAILGAYDAPTESWSVTFLSQDDVVIETRTVAAGDPIGTLPEAPAREGYSFVAWVSEEGIVDETTPVTSALTLRASYQQDYPATVADAQTEDLQVHVEVPEGALPADARFRMTAVNSEDYREAVEQALGMTTGTIKAVDMTFVGADGAEYQPLKPVTVQVTVKGMGEAEKLSVVHIADSGEAEVVYAGEPETIKMRGGEDQKILTFEAKSFSIYAITDNTKRLQYNFYDGTTLLASEFITRDENNQLQELYDPGVEPEYGQTFIGWAYAANQTDPSQIYTIEELNQQALTKYNEATEELTEINIYAAYYEAWYLRYMDQDAHGDATVLNVVRVRKDANNKSVTIDYSYTPEAGTIFEGWIDVATGQVYHDNETITLDHHVDLYLKVQGRNWLVFDSNAGGPGSGATYISPQLLIGNATTEKPDDPERRGYTFTGWNTNADGTGTWWYRTDGSINRFGNTLSSDTTLYAQWEAKDTAYYVVFWKQKATATGHDPANDYDYVSSEARTGKTGSSISITQEDKRKGNYQGNNSGEYGYYFTYNNDISDSDSKIISADGTTQLNIYYDRKEITYKFNGSRYTYTKTSSTSNAQTLYGLVGGEYVELTRNGRSGNYSWSYNVYEPTDTYNYTTTYYGFVYGNYVQIYYYYNLGWAYRVGNTNYVYSGTRYIKQTQTYTGDRYTRTAVPYSYS